MLQKWLSDGTSTLRYTYVACLPIFVAALHQEKPGQLTAYND
jgi:hypothetical protein